jgi:hypothetical protein
MGTVPAFGRLTSRMLFARGNAMHSRGQTSWYRRVIWGNSHLKV